MYNFYVAMFQKCRDAIGSSDLSQLAALQWIAAASSGRRAVIAELAVRDAERDQPRRSEIHLNRYLEQL